MQHPKTHHTERCPKCKETVKKLLEKIYGKVESNYKFTFSTDSDAFKSTLYYSELKEIYGALQNHRNFKEFIKAKIIPRCDFFVPNPGFIVEFDESQHFTQPRKIALRHYPDNLQLGFDKEKWIKKCEETDAKDNDPPYRDEQRAWYDTLRDFLPILRGLKPTARLYSKEIQWCALNPNNPDDVEIFSNFLETKKSKTLKRVTPTEISDMFLEFEYLLQQVKLQFLKFLANREINPEIKKIGNLFKNPEEEKQPLCLGVRFGKGVGLFTGSVYVGRPYGTISSANYPYFLISQEEKKEAEELLQKVGEINGRIKSYILSIYEKTGDFKNFLTLISEYFLTKVVVHELIVDLPGFHSDGEDTAFLFPEELIRHINATDKEINYGDFRELIVTFLRFGKSPADLICQEDDNTLEITNLQEFLTAVASYRYHHYLQEPIVNKMLARAGYQVMIIIKRQGKSEFFKGFPTRYMRWNRYAMCAFDTGPVFLRKKKELMMDKFVKSFMCENFSRWDKSLEKGVGFRNMMKQLLGKCYRIILDYRQFDWSLEAWSKKNNREKYRRIIERAQKELTERYSDMIN